MKEIRVQIEMSPPKEASPNWRGHWAKKARAVKSWREAACVCGLQATNCNPPFLKKVEVSVEIVVKDHRYLRDPDNMVASLKPALDGCVDAGIIVGDSDKHLRYRLPILYTVSKERAPLTILTFKETKI